MPHTEARWLRALLVACARTLRLTAGSRKVCASLAASTRESGMERPLLKVATRAFIHEASRTMKSDSEIQQAVQCELEWDSRVDHTDIGVTVKNGVVTLSGTAGCWAKRMAAQEAAHRVDGVLDVANDIRVKLSNEATRTDADIAQAVRLALDWNAFVPRGAIHSTVSDGVVTLEGEVEFLVQHDEAEKAIEHLAGVRFVINNIVLRHPRTAPCGDVRQAIHDALERRAARESHRVSVDNHDGIVTLSGSCCTWAEKKAIVGAARGTRGVRSVRDELRIVP